MKKFAALALLAFSLSSQAEVFKCTFTEPFVDLEYNTDTQVLKEFEAVMQTKRVVKKVSFQIKYAGTFLLKDSKGKILAEMKLENKGSDGMSDAIYPYEIKYNDMLGKANSGIGGCTSTLKPMVKAAE